MPARKALIFNWRAIHQILVAAMQRVTNPDLLRPSRSGVKYLAAFERALGKPAIRGAARKSPMPGQIVRVVSARNWRCAWLSCQPPVETCAQTGWLTASARMRQWCLCPAKPAGLKQSCFGNDDALNWPVDCCIKIRPGKSFLGYDWSGRAEINHGKHLKPKRRGPVGADD
jgi:hypothetical protein